MSKTNAMISIDFWNTLVKAETGGKIRRQVRIDALREVAEDYVENLSIEEIENAKREVSRDFDRIWFKQQRTPTTQELVNQILSHLGIPATKDEQQYLVHKFEESLWEGPPELTVGVRKTLSKLADQYPLALISDTMYSPGRVIRRYLENNDLFDYFQCFVFSDETGYSKPNPRAYKQVLKKTGCSAQHSWHIGDLIKTDIAGAKKVGMKTILFTGVSGYSKSDKDEVEPDYICESWEEVREKITN